MDRARSSDNPNATRLVFVATDAAQARLFGDLALRLHRRGLDCRFVVHGDPAIHLLQPDWGDRLIYWWDAGKANGHLRPTIRPWLADPDAMQSPESSNSDEPSAIEIESIARYDAWRFGWTETDRRQIASDAAAFWSRIDLSHSTLIAWHGSDGWFVDAAIHRARRLDRPILFAEQGPLRRTPLTLVFDTEGTFPGIGTIPAERLATPLWPLEQERLADLRDRFCTGTRPYAHPRPYVFFPLQPEDDPGLFRHNPIFVNQHEAVAAVIGALPSNVDLFVQPPHTLDPGSPVLIGLRGLLRANDRWLEPTDNPLAMIAGASVVVTINSSAGVEALMWDRPLVVLGHAGYSGRGFTFDVDGAASLPRLLNTARTGIRPAAATSRQDRFLYQILRHHSVELNAAPLSGALDAASLDRITDALLAELGVTGPTTDWSAVTRAITSLERTLYDGLAATFAGLPIQRCLAVVSEPLTGLFTPFLESHQIITPADADDVPAAALAKAMCLVFMPDATPGRLDRVIERLLCRGASEVLDLAEGLACRPCPIARRDAETIAAATRDGADPSPAMTGATLTDPLPRRWIEALARTIATFEPEHIIEFGCRDGRVLDALRRQRPEAELVGVEFNETLLEAASRRLGADRRIQLIPADAQTGLPLSSGQVDTLVTCGAIDALAGADRPDVLTEFCRLAPSVAIHLEHDGIGPDEAPTDAPSKPSAQLALHETYWDSFGPVQLMVRHVDASAPGAMGTEAMGFGPIGMAQPRRSRAPRIAAYQFTEPLLTVLTLHSVGTPPPGCDATPAAHLFLPTGRFASLLGDMLSRGWRFMTLGEAFDRFEGGLPLPRQTAVLTFDDGYRGVFTDAFPILRELGLRAAVFPVTSAINGRFDGYVRTGMAPEIPCLTAAQLRELHAAGWDVGSHALTHPVLAHLAPRHVQTELAESRRELQDLLGADVRFFAFPHGGQADAFCDQHIEQVRAEGYALALTGREGFVSRADRSIAWPRVAVPHDLGPAALRSRLTALHRRTAGWLPDAPRAAADTATRARQIVRRCLEGGWSRVALYGADIETRRILSQTRPTALQFTALVDDAAAGASANDGTSDMNGEAMAGDLPTRRWRDLDRLDVQAVVVPADAAVEQIQSRMASRPGLAVLRMNA